MGYLKQQHTQCTSDQYESTAPLDIWVTSWRAEKKATNSTHQLSSIKTKEYNIPSLLKQRIYLKGPSTCSSLQHCINSSTRVRYSKLSLLCEPPVKTTTKIKHHGCRFSLLWALWAFKCSPLVITIATPMTGKKYRNMQWKEALSSLRCKIQTHGNSEVTSRIG